MGDNSQYFVEKQCREIPVYLKSSQQSTRAVATLKQMAFGEKVKIKYAKNIVEESKDKINRMDQLADTTENNVCTLGYHHHHQN